MAQRWRPDTCDCYFEYDFDKTALNRTPEMFKNVIMLQQCSRHIAGVTPSLTIMLAHQDNWLRNDTRQIVISSLNWGSDSLAYEKILDSFTLSGVLHISFSVTVTQQKKNIIQSACDLQFGIGKVVID